MSGEARLILLGTAGGPTPKVGRAAPAQVLVVGDSSYVVDCGNGTPHQMMRAGVPLSSMKALFITHHHSDHNADYAAMLLLAWASGLVTPVATVGPPPLMHMTEAAFELNAFDIAIREEDEGRQPLRPLVRPKEVTEPGIVFEDDRVRVTAVLVDHPPIPIALAYRLDTEHRSFVISGDTAVCPALAELASGADVLVHESIHLPAIDAMVAHDKHAATLRDHLEASHTSPADAGVIAERAGVGTLVLSHLVPSTPDVTDEQWRAMAAQTFSGRVIVGADLMTI